MITKENPLFFNIFSGENNYIYEKLIMEIYNEIYRGSMGEIIPNKSYMKSLTVRVLQDIDQEKFLDMNDDSLTNFSRKTIDRLEETGWIESKYDSVLMEYIYNFTRIGRKVAQSLYQINNKETITRHRNVRTTLGLLESYKRDGDPYDLVDALEASDYIVSDLMDQINEVNDARKKMIKDATQNINYASENFLDYIEKDFKSNIIVYFREDSISQNANRINEIITDILSDSKGLDIKNRRMKERYPNLLDNEYPVDEQLLTISDRIKNAKDNKMPELINAIESLFKFSEMVLKQVGSLMVKSSSYMNSLAIEIQNANETEKEKILNSLAGRIQVSKSRYFDPYKIKIREIQRKRKRRNSVVPEEPPSPEIQREMMILKKIRESRGYRSSDVEKKLIELFKYEEQVINGFVAIENYKDLSSCLHLVSVAKSTNIYNIKKTGFHCTNKYFTTDEYTITKKEEK